MSTPRASVQLAPREIRDLVDRSCRVAGCDAGLAARLAANVLHTEIHRGDGLQTFVAVLAAGPAAVGALAAAADVIEQAEVEARQSGSSTAMFAEQIPLAAFSYALWEAAVRGVAAPSVPGDARGGDVYATVDFSPGSNADHISGVFEKRQADAFQQGIPVPQAVLAKIEAAAEEFLVPEATLDALVD